MQRKITYIYIKKNFLQHFLCHLYVVVQRVSNEVITVTVLQISHVA